MPHKKKIHHKPKKYRSEKYRSDWKSGERKEFRRKKHPPELLFHSMSKADFLRLQSTDIFQYQDHRLIFCSKEEDYAWHVAHRCFSEPAVAIIDVTRARKQGVRFSRNKRNLWEISSIPTRFILNAHPHFKEQISAGGVPLFFDNGIPKVALIKVQRPGFSTWEVAKGKLEIGESPKQAALREIYEEMGWAEDLKIIDSLGETRFGLFTPNKEPRLKTLYLYLMETTKQQRDFIPARHEGIEEVAWFGLDEAIKIVTHRSLFFVMKKLREKIIALQSQRFGQK